MCRSPHGERVLKHTIVGKFTLFARRSPHGERVLKPASFKGVF